MLIAARAAQGIGAATLAPASLSLITSTHPDPVKRGGALAIWGAAGASAAAFGVVAGGVLTDALPLTVAATAGVPHADAGLASGLFNVARQVGGAVGLAVLVTIADATTRQRQPGHAPLEATLHGHHLALAVTAAVIASLPSSLRGFEQTSCLEGERSPRPPIDGMAFHGALRLLEGQAGRESKYSRWMRRAGMPAWVSPSRRSGGSSRRTGPRRGLR